MKKKSFVLFIVTILIFTVGCSIVNRDKASTAGDWNLEELNSNLLQETISIKTDGKPVDLVKFLDVNMIRMRAEELTESVYLLNDMQESYLKDYNKFIAREEYQSIISENFDKISETSFNSKSKPDEVFEFIDDVELKNKLLEAYGGDYKLCKGKDNYKFIIDYDRYNKYENNIHSEIKNYIDIQKADQEFDQGEEISFDKLGKKLISIEEHLQKYSNGFGYEELLRMYSEDLRIFMEGSEELPLVDEGNKIKLEALEAYDNVITNGGITSDSLKEYVENIKLSEGIMTEDVMDSVLTIHNTAIALLEK